MGGSYYSKEDYTVRSSMRAEKSAKLGIDIKSATFAHSHDIDMGKAAKAVHKTLKPLGVNRESRDSKEHPVSVPIGIILDTTGSMADVPVIIQEKLSHQMGCFLDDKASGKKYLGDGYPAILIGAVDDYQAQKDYGIKGGDGALQVGQFESGLEIDDNLTNLWLTRNGGGTYSESYELALYFFAKHTAHDHFDKRGRKGYLFMIGDEHPYKTISKKAVKDVIGDDLQADLKLKDIIAEVKKRYHVFFIIPNMTSHYADEELRTSWVDLLGQQNVIKLKDPNKICELIAASVAICEEHIGIDELSSDLDFDTKSLVSLSKSAVEAHSTGSLPAVAGKAGGVERL